jgi:hypothetical protein
MGQDSLDEMFLLFNRQSEPFVLQKPGISLSHCKEHRAYLGPHFCCDDTDILMPNLNGGRDQLGVDNVFPKQDESISGSRDMFRMLLCLSSARMLYQQ